MAFVGRHSKRSNGGVVLHGPVSVFPSQILYFCAASPQGNFQYASEERSCILVAGDVCPVSIN